MKSGKKNRGRGTTNTIDPRFLEQQRESFQDGWTVPDDDKRVPTSVSMETARTIITKNQSPDIPFDRSINPYRGCEHGCNYCYARPSHAYLDLSPGIDFETKLFAKTNAAELLYKELAATNYICKPIAFGTNTDPYQPIEREHEITRSLIELLLECQHPVTIVTKSRLVLRDIDLLGQMAERGLVQVFISVTTMDKNLSLSMEPRASAPYRRLETIKALSEANIPVGLMFAPVIPCVNDSEMETIIEHSAECGARTAGYVMLRLPLEVSVLFREWLELNLPLRKEHVMSLLNEMREGKDYDAAYHTRMRGSGVYANLIRRRFEQACKKFGLNKGRLALRDDLFVPPVLSGSQQSLF